MEKQKGGNIGALDKHHEREKEAYQSNPDIDPARTPLNHHPKHDTTTRCSGALSGT